MHQLDVAAAVQIGYFHGFIEGVDYVFVDHPCFRHLGENIYGGDRMSIAFRCALLCKAALEAVWHVPCGGVSYGDDNLVYIANDWHAALLPVYLQVLLLLSMVMHIVLHVPCGGVSYGDDNLFYIANDWHTALLPVYLHMR